MNKETIILKTIDFVKETLSGAEGGHDWWHVYRVWKLSKHIAEIENVDIFIVELGALLHDIADSKFHNGDEEIGPNKATTFLQSLKVPEGIITHVENIIANISFKGGNFGFKSISGRGYFLIFSLFWFPIRLPLIQSTFCCP